MTKPVEKPAPSSLFDILTNDDSGADKQETRTRHKSENGHEEFLELQQQRMTSGTSLADRFIVPPFSILEAEQGYWQEKQTRWIPAFDPLLCEIVYGWHLAKNGGHVLDPFGDSTRAIVAGCLGYDYTGFEPNRKKMTAYARRAALIQTKFPEMRLPKWICADPTHLEEHLPTDEQYDLIFTDLPIYSIRELNGDYETRFKKIFGQAVARLKQNHFVVFIARGVHDGAFIRFTPVQAVSWLEDCDAHYYNEGHLVMSGNTRQALLTFFKGDSAKDIPKELGLVDLETE